MHNAAISQSKQTQEAGHDPHKILIIITIECTQIDIVVAYVPVQIIPFSSVTTTVYLICPAALQEGQRRTDLFYCLQLCSPVTYTAPPIHHASPIAILHLPSKQYILVKTLKHRPSSLLVTPSTQNSHETHTNTHNRTWLLLPMQSIQINNRLCEARVGCYCCTMGPQDFPTG